MIKEAAIIKDGIIYTGKRHCDILNSLDRPYGFLKNCEQGFITDKGKFVNRHEAAEIAYSCKQIQYPKVKLCSEDLYLQ